MKFSIKSVAPIIVPLNSKKYLKLVNFFKQIIKKKNYKKENQFLF